jgi:hypothetical protein
MSQTGKKVAQVKRKLNAGEPLTGDLLEFTLGLLPDSRPNRTKSDEVWVSIEGKLKAGETLGEYEHHLMVDMVLLHVRLAAATSQREAKKGDGGPMGY